MIEDTSLFIEVGLAGDVRTGISVRLVGSIEE